MLSPPLPLDLLRPILAEVLSKDDLLALCLVSNTFLAEARPLLYSDVQLRSSSVATFCRLILGPSDSSPELPKYVRRLSIQLATNFTDLDLLACALHRLPNLRALAVTCPQPAHWVRKLSLTPEARAWGHVLAAGILRGCPFKLTTFATSFGLGPDLAAFLADQPALEELVLFDTWTALAASSVLRLDANILPELALLWTVAGRLEFYDDLGNKTARTVRTEMMDIVIGISERP